MEAPGWDLWVVTVASEADARAVADELVAAVGVAAEVIVEPRRRGNLLGTLDALRAAADRVGPLDGRSVGVLHDAGAATRSAALIGQRRRGGLVVGTAPGGGPLTLLGAVARSVLPLSASRRPGRVDVFWASQLLLVDPTVAGDAPGAALVKRFVPGTDDALDDLGLARLADRRVVDFRQRGSWGPGKRDAWLRDGPAWRDVGGVSLDVAFAAALSVRLAGLPRADVDPALVAPEVAAGRVVGAHDLGPETGWLRLRHPHEWAAAASTVRGAHGAAWRSLLGLADPEDARRIWAPLVEASVVP
jgi:hypothetical protein